MLTAVHDRAESRGAKAKWVENRGFAAHRAENHWLGFACAVLIRKSQFDIMSYESFCPEASSLYRTPCMVDVEEWIDAHGEKEWGKEQYPQFNICHEPDCRLFEALEGDAAEVPRRGISCDSC